MDVKDLVGMLVEQNKAYKEMLQWSIGSIITILVIFLTANFFTMRRMRKDEIERLQAEIRSEVAIGIKEQELPDIEKQLNERLTELLGEKLNSFESMLNSFDSRLQRVTNMQSSQVKGLNNQFHTLRGDFHYLEGEVSVLDKVYENAFESFLEAGNAYLEAGTREMTRILNRLEETAEKLNYVQSDLSDFTRFSRKLDNDIHEHQVNKIIDILKTKKGIRSINYDDID